MNGPPPTDEARTVRVGVLGAGAWASNAHLPGFARDPRCEVVALADPQSDLAQATGTEFEIPTITGDHLEVINRDDIDLIDVCTPSHTHFELAWAALEAGKHVLCDRYTDSTRVYQGIRKLGRTELDPLLEFATRGLMPDMTIIIDVPVETGLERAKGAGGEYEGGDRMERQANAFHQSVRQGFLKLAESLSEQGRMVLVDAAPPKTIEQIHEVITARVASRLWGVADQLEGEYE